MRFFSLFAMFWRKMGHLFVMDVRPFPFTGAKNGHGSQGKWQGKAMSCVPVRYAAAACVLACATVITACGGDNPNDADDLPAKVTLAASPATITLGGSATLTWSSTNATACTASGAWSGT